MKLRSRLMRNPYEGLPLRGLRVLPRSAQGSLTNLAPKATHFTLAKGVMFKTNKGGNMAIPSPKKKKGTLTYRKPWMNHSG